MSRLSFVFSNSFFPSKVAVAFLLVLGGCTVQLLGSPSSPGEGRSSSFPHPDAPRFSVVHQTFFENKALAYVLLEQHGRVFEVNLRTHSKRKVFPLESGWYRISVIPQSMGHVLFVRYTGTFGHYKQIQDFGRTLSVSRRMKGEDITFFTSDQKSKCRAAGGIDAPCVIVAFSRNQVFDPFFSGLPHDYRAHGTFLFRDYGRPWYHDRRYRGVWWSPSFGPWWRHTEVPPRGWHLFN